MNPLRQRLAELQARPGDDGPELDFVAGLLDRAEVLGEPGRGLARRAARRLEDLAARRDAARAGVDRDLHTLARRGLEPPEAVHQALGAGAPGRARRLLLRQLGEAQPVRARATQERLRRLHLDLQGRGLRLPGPLEARLDPLLGPLDLPTARALAERGRPLAQLLASLLLEHACRDTRALTALRRAARRRPAVAGPYNPDLLVARLFEALAALSPRYLHDVVELHARLAALQRLPEPGDPGRGHGRRRRQTAVLDPSTLQARRYGAGG